MRLTLSEMRAALADRPEFRFVDHDNGMTVGCYMIAGQDSFRDDWALECRGVTFDTATGECVGRPLPKFFNVGERPETQPDALNWQLLAHAYEKRDGSLIHTVKSGDYFALKSKKSFSAPQVIAARKWLDEHPALDGWIHQFVCADHTVIMEWTAPDNRVVIPYDKPRLTVLHVRNNKTGAFIGRDGLQASCETYGLPLAQSISFDVDGLVARVGALEEVEGFVLQFSDGTLMKLKTQWYLDRHHYMTELRERDVARAVLHEKLDDIRTILPTEDIHTLGRIKAVEDAVISQIDAIVSEVDTLFASTAGQDRKTIAIAHKEHPFFALLMQRCSGKEPDFKKFYEKFYLDERWGLELVTAFGRTGEAA